VWSFNVCRHGLHDVAVRRPIVVGYVCRRVPRDVAVRRPTYICLLRPVTPLQRVILLKQTYSVWFLKLGGHVTTLMVS